MSDEKTALQIAEEIIETMRLIIDATQADQGHEHHWEILSVQYPETTFHPRLTGYTTNVLVRCDICNLPQVITLNDKWTLEQVKGVIDGSDTTADRPASTA
jgi:hypothetical protein